jgi:hypothetical protein
MMLREGPEGINQTGVERSAAIRSRQLRVGMTTLVIAACLWFAPASGLGEEPGDQDYQRATREFGELLSWQNRQGLDRIPASEKLLLGMPLRREGVTPRVSVTEVYTDNVFFTDQCRCKDWITKIAPGLSYLTSGGKGQLSADYSFESRLYANKAHDNTVASRHNGEVFGLWNVSNRTTVSVFDRFESFQDPVEQQTPGILGTFGRTSINMGMLIVKHRVASSVDLVANYGNFLWAINRPGSIDSMTHEGEVGVRVRETQQGRTTVKYRFRFFDFQRGRDFQSHSALLGHEIDLSETLAISGMIGAVHVQPNPSTTEVLAQASIRKSFENSVYELGYVRDVFPPSGGISQPVIGDFVRTSAKIRLINNVLLDAGLAWVLSNTSSNDFNVHTLRWNAGVSYSPTSWFVARLGYDMFDQREDILGVSADRLANRASLRLTAVY